MNAGPTKSTDCSSDSGYFELETIATSSSTSRAKPKSKTGAGTCAMTWEGGRSLRAFLRIDKRGLPTIVCYLHDRNYNQHVRAVFVAEDQAAADERYQGNLDVVVIYACGWDELRRGSIKFTAAAAGSGDDVAALKKKAAEESR